MSSYNGENLFGSGPHTFAVQGLALRHQTQPQPGVDGAQVMGLGRSARQIEQTGTLLADSLDDLTGQLDAIEAAMDSRPAELIDDLGRVWPAMLMIHFKPANVRRVGLRLAVDYQVDYLQARG